LINDVLDLSKIQAGRMDLNPQVVDIAPLVQQIAMLVQPLMAKQQNVLEVDCPADVGNMCVDITKLRKTLLNLLNNAAKFTAKGRITLTVTRVRGDRGLDLALERAIQSGTEDWLMFQVCDTGIGMTAAQIDHLFQSFTQADGSMSRKYGGTGLGLALSQHFAQMMGGEIAVSSALNQGSCFALKLPESLPVCA
jgi:signal transduction histidine kinase